LCAFLHESIVIQCFSLDKLCKGQLAELPTILDSFYTTITNDHIGVEIGGGGEPRKWRVFPHVEVEVDTARRSHLRPIQALDITNSSQFDGQPFLLVVWRFLARWVLAHSHHYHLKTTQALKQVRQAREISPSKSRPGK